LNVPLLAVNHLQGHLLSVFLNENKPDFPYLCLTVSGGHTQLTIVKDYLDNEVIGKTLDDAAGEAFDKSAKLLGFDYPGGPLIDKHSRNGNPKRFPFPASSVGDFNFSFSGLKTAILYFLRNETQRNPNFIEENKSDLCASIQHRIVKTLLDKLFFAAKQLSINNLAIVGGVSANSELRKQFVERCKFAQYQGFIPPFEYCTDNAAMIAITGHQLFINQHFANEFTTPYA